MATEGDKFDAGTEGNETSMEEAQSLKQFLVDMHHALITEQAPPPMPTLLGGLLPTVIQQGPDPSTAVEDLAYPPGFRPAHRAGKEPEGRPQAPLQVPVFRGPARPTMARSNSVPHLQAREHHYDQHQEPNPRHSDSYEQVFHHESQAELDRFGKLDESEVLQKVKGLEQAIRIMQGYGDRANTSFKDLCPYPELQLPEGFVIPKFELYTGQGDPRVHMKTYCNKMRGVKKDKLLLAYFSESLGGAAAEWFMRHDVTKWPTFEEMAHAFYDQYKYYIEVLPDRSSLDAIRKKPSESFREYALRWREQAARVSPAIPDEDMVRLFLEAQDEEFYGSLISAWGKPFSEVVKMGEMIEKGVKTGKIVSQTTFKGTIQAGAFEKKKQDDVAMVGSGPRKWSENRYNQAHSQQVPQIRPPQPYCPPQNPQYSTLSPQYSVQLAQPYAPAYFHPQWRTPSPQHIYPTHQAPHNHFQARPEGPSVFRPNAHHQKLRQGERNRFTPIGESYASLFQKLQDLNMLKPIAGNVISMAKVDHTRHCAYHSGMPGHDTNDCRSLKKAIQSLIDDGQIQVEGPDVTNINQNPLPDHGA